MTLYCHTTVRQLGCVPQFGVTKRMSGIAGMRLKQERKDWRKDPNRPFVSPAFVSAGSSAALTAVRYFTNFKFQTSFADGDNYLPTTSVCLCMRHYFCLLLSAVAGGSTCRQITNLNVVAQ